MTGQGSPNTPHHIGTGTHLKPEVGSLQTAPSIGRSHTDTSTTGKDHRRTPGRGGYFSGIAQTKNWASWTTIGGDGRKLEGMAKGGYQVKRPRHETLGQTGECGEVSVQRRTHPYGDGIDDYIDHP